MNYFENALCELIDLEAEVSSKAAESHDECGLIASELRDIIAEFRKHHETLVYQDHLIKKLTEVQL